jgi:hypothetical protein
MNKIRLKNARDRINMRCILLMLLPILMIGCDPERKTGDIVVDVKSTDGETARDEVSGETKRKARVQDLLQQLADTSHDEKEVVYTDLRDVYVRKRDIPDLVNAIDGSRNLEVKNRLKKLISFMDGKWRLPNNEWTININECSRVYEKEFDKFGCYVVLGEPPSVYSSNPDLVLDVFDFPPDTRLRAGVVDLILMLEPEALMLSAEWSSIEFTKILKNLKVLKVGDAKIIDYSR